MTPEMPPIDWSQPVHPQELAQMRDFARLSLWEKMGWLEEAQRFVEHMQERRALREGARRVHLERESVQLQPND